MFPLNINADYNDSISFDKGCFIGQEVNARARFTGVIRKRLCVFIALKNKLDVDLPPDSQDNTFLFRELVDLTFSKSFEGTVIKNKEKFKTLLITSKIRRGIWKCLFRCV